MAQSGDHSLNSTPEKRTRPLTGLHLVEKRAVIDFDRFSKFNRLQRVLVFILRFLDTFRIRQGTKQARDSSSETVLLAKISKPWLRTGARHSIMDDCSPSPLSSPKSSLSSELVVDSDRAHTTLMQPIQQ